MQILDHHGAPIATETIARQRMMASLDAYRAGSEGTATEVLWDTSIRSPDHEWNRSRNRVVGRVRDLRRNDARTRAGVQKVTDLLVGGGLRLSSRLDYEALGLEPDEGRVLRSAIEREWRNFANDPLFRCDAARKLMMTGIEALLSKQWRGDGEMLAALEWHPEFGGRYATCVRVIDPDRLSNPNGAPDTDELRSGVAYDADTGAPIGYHIQKGHPGDIFRVGGRRSHEWDYLPRATAWGRPIVIHAFEPDRPDQARGVPDLVAALSKQKMLSRFTDSEIQSATINAMFAAFITSGFDPATVSGMLSADDIVKWNKERVGHYGQQPVVVAGSRIPILPPGDTIAMNASPRQTAAFDAFTTVFLREFALVLGLSYEQFAMDFSKTNYSSARAALNEVWRFVVARRDFFTGHVMTPVLLALLEEAFARGYLTVSAGAPSLYEMPAAYVAANWIGPGRGYIDPVKEAQASQMRRQNLTSTLQDECAEQGRDWEEVLDQTAREKQRLDELGLTEGDLAAMLAVEPATDRPGA